ncbi:MAG: GAF domain-containing protein, partial [Anaerolineales bacterium]|nr:GAF domain-containing protein [Anaerolineales bacterium]
QYQKESESAVARLETLEASVLGVTLFALLMEALFIFRPMVWQITKRTEELEESLLVVGRQNTQLESRSRAILLSTQVSRRLSMVFDQKTLVSEVVNQVRDVFGYYHTQIYFFDSANEYLVMAGGTGEAGRTMLSQSHQVMKGRGLVGRAAESNQPVLVSDTSQNPEWLPNPLLPDTKSEIAIPISVGARVLGVLDVQHNLVDGLQSEDVDALTSIANQVAVAFQNIRQYENTRKIASDMGVVATVGIATSTITDVQQLLQEVVDLSKKSFNLYHAHIYLLNETGDLLDLSAGAGEVGRQMVLEKHSIPLDREQSLVARAARTREGVVVNDVTIAPDFLPNPLLPDTRAEMAVPMVVADKVIGVLDVQSEIAGHFTDVDVSIETTLASQVAVALQNARNFSQSQRQAERETAVNLITQKIQNATSIESALQVAARELGHALGMRPTVVALEASSALAGTSNDN